MNVIEKPFDPTTIFMPLNRAEKEEESPSTVHLAAFQAGYEFKILRATSSYFFENTERFQQALAEEQQNGWELVEKLDNQRIRLVRKRPSSRFSSNNGVDPYRAVIGMTTFANLTMVLFVLAGVAAGGLYMIWHLRL